MEYEQESKELYEELAQLTSSRTKVVAPMEEAVEIDEEKVAEVTLVYPSARQATVAVVVVNESSQTRPQEDPELCRACRMPLISRPSSQARTTLLNTRIDKTIHKKKDERFMFLCVVLKF